MSGGQRKWEVKFAPQLATATRRTMVMSSDVQNLMDKYSDESQLRTAVDRTQASSTDVGGKVRAQGREGGVGALGWFVGGKPNPQTCNFEP